PEHRHAEEPRAMRHGDQRCRIRVRPGAGPLNAWRRIATLVRLGPGAIALLRRSVDGSAGPWQEWCNKAIAPYGPNTVTLHSIQRFSKRGGVRLSALSPQFGNCDRLRFRATPCERRSSEVAEPCGVD